MVQIAESQTGEKICKILGDFLFSSQEVHLRRRNLMGIATDGGRNMINSKGSGATNRLQVELPYILVVHDLCHAFFLVLKISIFYSFQKTSKDYKKNLFIIRPIIKASGHTKRNSNAESNI